MKAIIFNPKDSLFFFGGGGILLFLALAFGVRSGGSWIRLKITLGWPLVILWSSISRHLIANQYFYQCSLFCRKFNNKELLKNWSIPSTKWNHKPFPTLQGEEILAPWPFILCRNFCQFLLTPVSHEKYQTHGELWLLPYVVLRDSKRRIRHPRYVLA